jgi:hypothetical protein
LKRGGPASKIELTFTWVGDISADGQRVQRWPSLALNIQTAARGVARADSMGWAERSFVHWRSDATQVWAIGYEKGALFVDVRIGRLNRELQIAVQP